MHPRLLLLFLLLAACADPSEPPGFSEGDDDDTVAGDDDDSTPPADDDDLADALEIAGSLGLWCWAYPDDDWVAVTRCRFDASFRALLEEGTPGAGGGGVSMNTPDGVDDCAITVWDAADLEGGGGGTPAHYDDLSAGSLTLAASDWSVDLEPEDDGAGSVTYSLELGGGSPPRFDAAYSLAAAGEQFPAFTAADAIWVPQALLLQEPAPTAAFAIDGSLEIAWTGGSEETLWLELHNETTLTTGNAQITCSVANDGAFEIPAELTAQLPPDALRLVLGQPVSGWFEAGGYRVDVGSTATVETRGHGG